MGVAESDSGMWKIRVRQSFGRDAQNHRPEAGSTTALPSRLVRLAKLFCLGHVDIFYSRTSNWYHHLGYTPPGENEEQPKTIALYFY